MTWCKTFTPIDRRRPWRLNSQASSHRAHVRTQAHRAHARTQATRRQSILHERFSPAHANPGQRSAPRHERIQSCTPEPGRRRRFAEVHERFIDPASRCTSEPGQGTCTGIRGHPPRSTDAARPSGRQEAAVSDRADGPPGARAAAVSDLGPGPARRARLSRPPSAARSRRGCSPPAAARPRPGRGAGPGCGRRRRRCRPDCG